LLCFGFLCLNAVENVLFPLFVYHFNARKSAEWLFVGIFYATFFVINLIYLINIFLCNRERMRIKKASLMAERVRRQTALKFPGSAKSSEVENVVQEVLVEHGNPSTYPSLHSHHIFFTFARLGIANVAHLSLQLRRTNILKYFSTKRFRKVWNENERGVPDYSDFIALAMKKLDTSTS
jgi:hypothetical protein